MTMFHLGNVFGCYTVIVSFQILFLYSHTPLVKIWKFNWEIINNYLTSLHYSTSSLTLTYKLLGTQIYFFTNTSKKSELDAYKKKKGYTIYIK